MLEKTRRLGADVVLLDLEDAVEQDDRKRAREPLIAALRELGWSACSGRRASTASSGSGATASSSR
jgi:citrate lyase beta subunit